ncbi:MAG: metallophosphatase [Candidatus Latescibacterota bacterium]
MKNVKPARHSAWRHALWHLLMGAMLFWGGSVRAEELRTVTVIYTSCNNGMLEACACPGNPRGGLARRAQLIRDIRAEVGEVLLLDSGDVVSPLHRPAKDEMVLTIYGLLNYDGIAIGDQEFGEGRDSFSERIARPGLPWISATLRDAETEKGMAPPYLIKTVSSIRVAVIGLIDRSAFEFMDPDRIQGITVADPVETMRLHLPELRKHADLVVVLSHLGDEGDVTLAEQVPGIDLIVGGHTQLLLLEPLKHGETMIVQAGPDGEYLGRLELTLDHQGRILATQNQLIPLDSQVQDDPEIAQQVAAYFSGDRAKSRPRAK